VITPERAVDVINGVFGHHRSRSLHAKGTVCAGTFTATPEAARLTRAAHMQGDLVEATVRVSNASGHPRSKDHEPDVRGLAVKFHLADGSQTDISAQTAPRFPVRTPDAFIELVRAQGPGAGRLWRMPIFLAKHPSVIPQLRRAVPALVPPVSYATRRYYAIHAFRWVDAEGGERWVRYTWLPEAGTENLGLSEARKRGRDYLQSEIVERLEREPVRFDLQVQIAGDGDDPHDATSIWPEDRETLVVGTLEITALKPFEEPVVFDPARVTDGIELSDDPILNFRPRAYSVSVERRT
jgi:catalase